MLWKPHISFGGEGLVGCLEDQSPSLIKKSSICPRLNISRDFCFQVSQYLCKSVRGRYFPPHLTEEEEEEDQGA